MPKPFFNCLIEFCPSPHLTQIYDGFWKLKQKGFINLETKRITLKDSKPIIKVIVNNTYTLIYDTLDGFNWTDGSFEENLEFVNSNYKCDFYFKRSFNTTLQKHLKDFNLYPLGLNFPFDYEGNYPLTTSERTKSIVKKYLKKNTFKSDIYEYPPFKHSEDKILFLCGLWNPDQVNSNTLKEQRQQINNDRMAFVRACKAEFGDRFTGGIQIDAYSQKVANDILVPLKITKKENFLNAIKEHNICIATTGLHNSIGWKFAEYTAASRAIISEPLHYELPGGFKENKNYLSFNTTDELISNIHDLLTNTDKMKSMMVENHRYYTNYVDSEKMILNTLLKVPH
ncbi:hypothetical protein AB9K26_09125 [Psychroserpens sp. XS_ASV72]|uniref:hypothetical protein n=1 Tax=Psychroserpens sp. XS_ASV72 TaxID=3241293 RepID=UPI00351419AA